MASITTWMRLEPHSRTADMNAGLEMRIHDPLWMLARQWQFGEYQGQDTGSAIWADFSRTEMPIQLYLRGVIDGHVAKHVHEYSPDTPLEFLVEAESTSASEVMRANRRLAAEAGEHFLWLLPDDLRNTYRAQLLQTHSMEAVSENARAELDVDSLAFLQLMAGRALDGARLLATVQQSTQSALDLGFDEADAPAASQAITRWLDWCGQTIGPTALSESRRQAWNPERMEYACALAAPIDNAGAQVVLTAVEYVGGHLDWYSFAEATGQKLQRDVTAVQRRIQSAAIPTALGFRGMPANRLWEFEDAQVRFGSIHAAPTDLARLLLVEFLIEYGNDFFIIPIDLQTGALFNIDSLTITNTFGDVTTANPCADESWRMFALANDSATKAALPSSALFLPPVLCQHFASPPLEDVHLLRDEMANLAWAVEQVVESQCGKPLNRNDAYQARRQREGGSQQAAAEGTLVYRLDTWTSSLPDYWIPLVPERAAPGQSAMQLVCYDVQGRSRGRLLAEHAPGAWLHLFDEEIPRTGAHVTRTQQYTRWYGGSIFSWLGREKRSGRGEGSSGLQYDVTEVIPAG